MTLVWSSRKTTLPRAAAKVGQPPRVTASLSVRWAPRTSSGVIISEGRNTERISASRASSTAGVKGSGATIGAPGCG